MRQIVTSFLREHLFQLIMGTGVFLFAGGGLIHVFFPAVLNKVVDWQVHLEQGNSAFEAWRESSIPVKSKIYVFDITNADDFLQGIDKPKLIERGPYVYNQYSRKESITFSDEGDKVKYYTRSLFVFDKESSSGSLNDVVTVPNAPILTIFMIINYAISDIPMTNMITPIVGNIASRIFNNHGEKLFMKMTVKELLEGKRMPVFDVIDSLIKPLRAFGVKIPDIGAKNSDKFGMIAMRNNSRCGPFESYTSSDKFTHFASYKMKNRLEQWSEETQCSQLKGSYDGCSFGPLNKNDQPISTLRIFNPMACRTLKLGYESDTDVRGIAAWRFRFVRDLFSVRSKENKCFCSSKSKNCLDGAIDLGPCMNNAPFALSFPHLLYADPRIAERVVGLEPDETKHLGYLDIEPTLGYTINGSARFQINLLFMPVKMISQLSRFKSTLLPYIWVDDGGEIDLPNALLLKLALYPIMLIEMGSVVCVLIGGFVILGASGYWLVMKNKKTNKINLVEKTRDRIASSIRSAVISRKNSAIFPYDGHRLSQAEFASDERRPSAPEMEDEELDVADMSGNYITKTQNEDYPARLNPGNFMNELNQILDSNQELHESSLNRFFTNRNPNGEFEVRGNREIELISTPHSGQSRSLMIPIEEPDYAIQDYAIQGYAIQDSLNHRKSQQMLRKEHEDDW